jgi:hypothetical protein
MDLKPDSDSETPESSNPATPGRSSSKTPAKAVKEPGYKVTFDGAAAEKLFWLESQLRERSSKPDMGQILGQELLRLDEDRWNAVIEENTDLDYFFGQIRRVRDKPKALRLLKSLSEDLLKENESPLPVV